MTAVAKMAAVDSTVAVVAPAEEAAALVVRAAEMEKASTVER